MGARAIYVCLKELARMQTEWKGDKSSFPNSTSGNGTGLMREPASVVEDVIFMGMPNHLSLASWVSIRRVVAGRVVNCFSSKDLILGLMFQYKRMSGLGRRVCGTSKVKVPGVENYDVSSLVHSHVDYCTAVQDILKLIEFRLPRNLVDQSKSNCVGDKDDKEMEEFNGGKENEADEEVSFE